jgi:hypothetical protein
VRSTNHAYSYLLKLVCFFLPLLANIVYI